MSFSITTILIHIILKNIASEIERPDGDISGKVMMNM
jgi:hypothetical protein